MIEQTRKVKQGVLKRLLTKGIAHTRFKQTEIGEIPEAWEIGILGEVVCNPMDCRPGLWSQLKAEEYVQDGIPVCHAARFDCRSDIKKADFSGGA